MFASLLISCEHAGNKLPDKWKALFKEHTALLASHRGWDPGALGIAKGLSSDFNLPLFACNWSRLLVEANRSLNHPQLFSAITKPLSPEEKKEILQHYYFPYRQKVEAAVDQLIRQKPPLLHLAVHSFTPVLDGQVRNVDIGLLYDPKRSLEKTWARDWQKQLKQLLPEYRIRLNNPYRGEADGLPTALRKRYTAEEYAGFELEISQGLLVDRSAASKIQHALSASLKASLMLHRD